jgi:hypothetical protein
MLNTYRARLLALIVLLILLRVMQGFYDHRQLTKFEEVVAAANDVGVAAEDEAKQLTLITAIFGAVQVYSNATFEKDLEKRERASGSLVNLIGEVNDLRALRTEHPALTAELQQSLRDNEALVDTYLKQVQAAMGLPVEAINKLRDARSELESEFNRLDGNIEPISARVSLELRAVKLAGEELGQDT